MEIALQPIAPPPELEDALDAEIRAWFLEAFFGPLFDLLPPEPVRAGAQVPFPESWGALGLRRGRLPQIAAGARADLIAFLAARGVRAELRQLRPDALRPAQSGYLPEKLERAREHAGADRPILASSDLRILDGHHQWTAAMLDRPDALLEVFVLDAPLARLLREVRAFPAADRNNGAERSNASDLPLVQALERGDVTYARGAFAGRFSAATSRALRAMGATWSAERKAFVLPLERVPYSVRGVIAMSRGLAEEAHRKIKETLGQIAAHAAEAPTAGLALDLWTTRLVTNLSDQFQRSLEVAANTHPALEVVTAPPDFSEGMVRDVRRNLTETLDLAIKNFTEEETVRLRQLVEANWEAGGRIDELRAIIVQRWGVTERKARFLAAQETGMVASEYARARAQEIGSTRYGWVTRHDKKVRDDHAELDGKVFEWDDPPIVDKTRGRTANPGMDYGCLPTDAEIEIADHIKKAFRRWYAGELSKVVTDDGRTFRATPNHPVLTLDGWKPIGDIDQSDYLVQLPFEALDPSLADVDGDHCIATIGEVFRALEKVMIRRPARGRPSDFHGDGSDGEIDVVGTTWLLSIDRQSRLAKRMLQFGFSNAATFTSRLGDLLTKFVPPLPRLLLNGGMACGGQSFSILGAEFSHTDVVRLRLIPDRNVVLDQNPSDGRSSKPSPHEDRQFAFAGNVCFDYRRGFRVSLVPRRMNLRNHHPDLSEFSRDTIRTKADALGHSLERHPLGQKMLRVVEVRREEFLGHVFNLETRSGWFGSNGIIFHNCRCHARPLLNLRARRVVA